MTIVLIKSVKLMTDTDKTKIHLTYIETSCGPWILIFGSMLSDFTPLINLFNNLSTGKKQYCELHHEPFIIQHDNVEVTLKSFPDQKCSNTLHRKSNAHAFEWFATTEKWADCTEMTTSLIDISVAGHQFIFSQSSIEILVVVSRGEYSNDTKLLL